MRCSERRTRSGILKDRRTQSAEAAEAESAEAAEAVSGLAFAQRPIGGLFTSEPAADGRIVAAEVLCDLGDRVAVPLVGDKHGQVGMSREDLFEWGRDRFDLFPRDLGDRRVKAERVAEKFVTADTLAPDSIGKSLVEPFRDVLAIARLGEPPRCRELSEDPVGTEKARRFG
jgi:hypothetical protein